MNLEQSVHKDEGGNTSFVRPNESVFFIEPRKGVIMGDLANVTSDKVDIHKDSSGASGLTLIMMEKDKTSFLWMDTTGIDLAGGEQKPSQSMLWIDLPYVYTGVCK